MLEISLKRKQCAHYWIIEPANGPTSKGQCKHCGMVAEFFNDLQVRIKKVDGFKAGKNSRATKVLDTDDMMLHVSHH